MNASIGLSYSSQNVSSSYVTLVASTDRSFGSLMLSDSSGQVIVLAVGAAGSEKDLIHFPVNGTETVNLGNSSQVPLGSRLSIKSLTSTASSGVCGISFFL